MCVNKQTCFVYIYMMCMCICLLIRIIFMFTMQCFARFFDFMPGAALQRVALFGSCMCDVDLLLLAVHPCCCHHLDSWFKCGRNQTRLCGELIRRSPSQTWELPQGQTCAWTSERSDVDGVGTCQIGRHPSNTFPKIIFLMAELESTPVANAVLATLSLEMSAIEKVARRCWENSEPLITPFLAPSSNEPFHRSPKTKTLWTFCSLQAEALEWAKALREQMECPLRSYLKPRQQTLQAQRDILGIMNPR